MARLGAETVIVGGGPAGLQLAYFLASRRRDYLVLEREQPGAFFKRFPRHRKLISINKVHTGFDDPEVNLRWDWNSLLCDDPTFRFSSVTQDYFPSADAIVEYFAAFAERYELNVASDVNVTRIERSGSGFELRDAAGNRGTCKQLVVATGLYAPHVPAIPGVELAEPYTSVSTDPAEFVCKRVLIIGKGNSAFETANHLVGVAAVIHMVSRRPIRMAWKTRFVGDLRAINNDFLDTYRLKSQNVVIDGQVVSMRREGGRIAVTFDYLHAHGETEEILYDRVILCTGFRFDTGIFGASVQPELVYDGRFPKQTCCWESSNVRGLFFAGAATQARDFKKTMSAFIHGFRYNTRALFHFMEEKYRGEPLPCRRLERCGARVARAVIERVNTSSALWQQPGFLGDFLLVRDNGQLDLYEDFPVAWMHERGRGSEYFVVTLEFGIDVEDPFDFDRPHRNDATQAAQSEALHPVVRQYRDGELLSVHHAMEDIAADWTDSVHVDPLIEYFGRVFSEPSPLARSA